MPAEIFVTRRIPDSGLRLLKKAHPNFRMNPDDRMLSREELLESVIGVEGLLCLLTDTIDEAVLDAAGDKLKAISNYAVGYDNIDVQAATERGIMVMNTPGVLTDATADHAWALLFSVARRVVDSDTFTRSEKFEGWGPMMFLGGDVTGKTLGIAGAGRIGTATALRAKAFNMKILYFSNSHNETLEKELDARKVEFDELLVRSDFISVHVPLTHTTFHLFNEKAFDMMKNSAYLINTARGPIVDEGALVKALKNRDIAGAGLDVFEEEPKVHPELFALDNVVLTPHIASATHGTRSMMATMAAQNLITALDGNAPENLLNPEVLK